MVKLVTWNINSIKARLEVFLNWLNKNNFPEIVLLQELKCKNENFPYQIIEDLGYNIALNGQKGRNGVAILSKFPIEDVCLSFLNDPSQEQSRYIEAIISLNKDLILRVASVYVPNGKDINHEDYKYKLDFLESFNQHAKKLLSNDEIIFIGGDFNVAQEEIDIFDKNEMQSQIGFDYLERKILRKLNNFGYYDLFRFMNPEKKEFSWWDYRQASFQKNRGLRIDYIFGSPKACPIVKNSYIDLSVRSSKKPSDHAPVIINTD